MYPVKQLLVRKDFLEESIKINFAGNGIVVLGNVKSQCGISTSDFVALLDVYIDGVKVESVKMPYDYTIRKYDIFYKYLLKQGDHQLEIKWTNQNPDYRIYFKSYVVYGESPVKSYNPHP
jgi:tRNA splicing ligase